jgi:adenylate kinase
MKIGLTRNYVKIERSLLILPFAVFLAVFCPVNEASAGEARGPFLVLIGTPASGKTSYSEYISKQYGVPAIDTQKVLQDEIARALNPKAPPGSRKPGNRRLTAWSLRNESMNAALKKFQKGELVSDELINTSVLLGLLKDDCRNGFVLDGYPDSVEQAMYLEGVLITCDVDALQVIVLESSDEFALEKMAIRNLPHDKNGFAEARLVQYRSNIGPILEYYRGDDLQVIDASREQLVVQAEIDRILGQ